VYKYLLLILFIIGCEKPTAPSDEITEEITLDQKCLSLIKINNYFCFIDNISNMMLYPISDNAEINGIIEYSNDYYDDLFINDSLIVSGNSYNFGTISINDTMNVKTVVEGETNNYNLIFTTLPTIMFYTVDNIVDEPKILSKVLINDIISNLNYNLYSGIEIRGGVSQSFPKVSYNIELWEDKSGSETYKEELFNLRNDDDWILDAMYIDLSKSRHIIGMNIWENLASASYLSEEEDARLGLSGHYVELFINNEYLGLYSFNEQIDRKQLQLDQSEGLLYKSKIYSPETNLEGIEEEPTSSINWGGFTLKHPDNYNELNWMPLKELIELVAYSDDETFSNSIEEIIDIDNAIDYFIFINIIQAFDNYSKNIFILRYNENYPLAYMAWDLDLCFGNNNSFGGELGFGDWVTMNSIMSNKLFDRLYDLDVNDYRNKVKLAWDEINNESILDLDIINKFTENINSLIQSNAHIREYEKWDLNSNISDELNYINNWISDRIIILSDYFDSNY